MPDHKVRTQVAVLDDTAEVVVVRGGTRIQFNASGGIDVFGDAPVMRHPPVNGRAPPVPPPGELTPRVSAGPKIGDTMEDGTKFAGISPDTGKPMYAVPVDAPLTMKWKQAMRYAATFKGHGHPKGTFRVPTKDELTILFENKAAIGGFNETGSDSDVRYWSSAEQLHDCVDSAWVRLFSNGRRGWDPKSAASSLRLVRS
jgi:hypothetical protein